MLDWDGEGKLPLLAKTVQRVPKILGYCGIRERKVKKKGDKCKNKMWMYGAGRRKEIRKR